MNRWHTESFSFLPTSYSNYNIPKPEDWGLTKPLAPMSDDPPYDGFALIPIELDWTLYGKNEGDNIAYKNESTGVIIRHFPAIHCRMGSISYRLEYNGMSVVFSGDTKPNHHMLNHASGADVVIHEIVMPAEVWADC